MTNDELYIPNGYNILIGNSGDPTNNHLDIFEKLCKIDIGNRKIYVPLSYGGDKDYIKEIINDGKRKWGDNFIPILDYVPLNDYKNILSSCSFFIFSHERQQAMGNIGISLRSGGKVFLSKTSIVYKYYKNIGMNISTIQDDLNLIGLNNKLTQEEIEGNIRLMENSRSTSVFYQDLIETINIIQAD